jgi:hypothetical protein
MIEFVIKNRRLRLHPDGVIYSRSFRAGKETKKETWKEIKFSDNGNGYCVFSITLDGKPRPFLVHRVVWFAHHQDWDIFDTSTENEIDHINRNRTDNSIGNLQPVTHQQNQFNKEWGVGYYWREDRQKFQAKIKVNGVQKHLGIFEKEEDARKAYEDAKKEYHNII